jgi:hypothetical protein
MVSKEKPKTKPQVCFQIISQDHTRPDNVHCDVKILSSGKIKTVSIMNLFYQDKWLQGFSLSDVRMIAKVHAQAEWYRDKAAISENNKPAETTK